MLNGYASNSGPNIAGVYPTKFGQPNYTLFSTRAAGGVQGVLGLAQSAGGARLVAVGDFTSVGNTPNLHGVAIFG